MSLRNNKPQPEQPASEPAPGEESNAANYLLSEPQEPRFQALAELAPTLKEAELRILIALSARTDPNHQIRISTRDLAAYSSTAHSAVRRALGSLEARQLITTRPGGASSQGTPIQLNFLKTRKFGVPLKGTPEPRKGTSQKPESVPRVPLKGTPVPLVGTMQTELFMQGVPPEGTPHIGERARIDFDFDSSSIIDRLLKASPKNQNADDMATVKKWVHGYHAKLGREKDPHPPDDRILAQLLAVGSADRIVAVIQDLMAERQEPGYKYGWYVTVALQRIHGIRPEALEAKRAELKAVRKKNEPPENGQEFTEQIEKTLHAGMRRML